MASLGTKLAAGARGDPRTTVIPRLDDDPAYASASELLGVLTAALVSIERERDRLDLERHFASRSPENDGETDKMLRGRLNKLRRDIIAVVPAATPVAAETPPAIADALKLLAGQPLPEPIDHAAHIRSLARQRDVVGAAIAEQSVVVDRLADELTFRYAKQLRPSWNDLMLRWYRAAQALAQVTREVHELRAKITTAGVRSRTDVLAMPNVRAPLVLGSEAVWDSEISGWRRILEGMGIL
jgi:hypothetical protein